MSLLDRKILLFANTDWYLYNFRLSLAHLLRERGWEVVLASPPGNYTPHLEDEGFRWVPVVLSRRGVIPHQELRSLLRLNVICKKERPDVLHNFTIKPVIYGSLTGCWLGTPVVVNSITGLGYLFLSETYGARLLRSLVMPVYRYLLANPRIRVIFENDSHQELFLSRGLVRAWQTTVIQGVGVDLIRFSPTPEPSDPPVVLMASRLLWDKGVREFVEAARLFTLKKTMVRFVLVGSPDPGNPSSIPVDQIRSWVQEGLIEWWGHRNDMPDVFANSHIVVLPSYGEGVPTVLMEAAASGRPIVASDVPGCREVVCHGETGLLTRVKDPRSVAEALETLIKDKDLRRRMGQRGRKWVELRFDQKVINEQTLRVYNDALQVKKGEMA